MKFLEELIFRKYQHAACDKVSAELQTAEIFPITLLRRESTTDLVPAILKVQIVGVESVFGIVTTGRTPGFHLISHVIFFFNADDDITEK